MKRLIDLATRHPVFSNLLMGVIAVAGILCAFRLPREIFPEFSLDRIAITVVYPGASPEEIEEAICLKIEEAIEGVDGIRKVESSAAENIGSVVVELKADVKDVGQVKTDIENRVDQITTFPEGSEEPRIEELLLRTHVISLVLYGNAPEASLRERARQVKDDLLTQRGVSQVSFLGLRDYEIDIEVSERTLQQYGLTLEDVARTVWSNSANVPGGTVRGQKGQVKLETKGRRYRGAEFKKIVLVSAPDGTTVHLGDVAQVIDGFEEDAKYGRFNGLPAVLLVVHKTKHEDAIQIAKTVKEYAARVRPTLPDGLFITTWVDTSQVINDRISLLLRNGLQGMVLVFLSLWLFLSFRLSFWVALGIPVSFATALTVLWLLGQSLNMVSLFGLIMALGLVVDDAIVVGENVHRRGRTGDTRMRAASLGTSEMALPVLAAVATTMVAFAPLFSVSGIMGKFIAVLPLAVIATLAGSTVECLFILPAHLAHGSGELEVGRGRQASLAAGIRSRRDRFIDWLILRAYRPAYVLSLRFRAATICLAIAALLATLGLVVGHVVPVEMFPKTDSEMLIARLAFAEGTPVSKTDAAIGQIEHAALSLNRRFVSKGEGKVVSNVYATVGQWSPLSAEPETGPHLGEVWIELLAADKRSVHSERVMAEWRWAAGPIPGAVNLNFSAVEGGPGGKPIELRIRGDRLVELKAVAQAVKHALAQYAGVYDIEDDYKPGKPQLNVRLKPQARVLGLTVEDLGRQLRAGYYGEEALRIQRGRDEVKVLARYPREERSKLGQLDRIRVRTASGFEIPFREVAGVERVSKPAVIMREHGRRCVSVLADVDPDVTNAEHVIAEMRSSLLPTLAAKHPDLRFSFEGQQQESRESMQSLFMGFCFALLVIYMILAASFHSYIQPAIIMAAIPFGMIGAVIGHWLLGLPLSMLSMFGMVALSGVVVNDSLVLIHRVNQGIRDGRPVLAAVEQAGLARFRAIVLTSLTTVAGLLPIIAEKSFQGQFVIPMAVSLAFGLIFATLLTLFVVPCLFLQLNTARRFVKWLMVGRWPSAEEVEPHALPD